MGRDSTGAWTVYRAIRLELSYLLEKGFIKKDCIISSTLTWSNNWGERTATIGLRSDYTSGNCFVEVSYSMVKDGFRENLIYRINLYKQRSNLKVGDLLYFICPETLKKCRILYLAYGYSKFRCRTAYHQRLYYDCQISSKLGKYNDNYWRLQSHLDAIKRKSRGGKRHYRGNITHTSKRYNRLYAKQTRMDELRFTIGVPKALRGYTFG